MAFLLSHGLAHDMHPVVKQRILDGIAGALGVIGVMTGAIRETIVWIRSKEKSS